MSKVKIKGFIITALFAVLLGAVCSVMTFATTTTAFAAGENLRSQDIGEGVDTKIYLTVADAYIPGEFELYTGISTTMEYPEFNPASSPMIASGGYWMGNYTVSFLDVWQAVYPDVKVIPARGYRVAFHLRHSMPQTQVFSSVVSIIDVAQDYTIEYKTVTDPAPPLGHFFDGWYYDAAFKTPYDNEPILSHVELYAKFTPYTYTINYQVFGGLYIEDKVYTVSSEAFTLPTPTFTGYTFQGWYTNSALTGTVLTQIPKGTVGNMTLYAKWEKNKYKVTFYTGTTVYKEIWVNHGTSLVNYSFIDGSGEAVALYQDINMVAEYGDKSNGVVRPVSIFTVADADIMVKVVIMVDGEPTEKMLPYNTAFSALEKPTKEGYRFEGWYYDAAFTKPVDSASTVLTETTVYAKFVDLTFGQFIADFFTQWWWAFVVAGGLIIFLLIMRYALSPKKARRRGW